MDSPNRKTKELAIGKAMTVKHFWYDTLVVTDES